MPTTELAFKKNDRVKWEKKGKSFAGHVIAVVPKGVSPHKHVDWEDVRKRNVKALGLIATMQPRDHDSYLIEVLVGDREIKAIYWPPVSLIQPE